MGHAVNVSWDDRDGEHDAAAGRKVVEDLIGSLDGEERTHVSLGDPERHLVCGGAAAVGLVLFVQLHGEIHQLLSSTADRDGTVELVAAGQPGVYPTRFVVDLQRAKQAARTFVEDSTLETSLPWELQR